MQDTATVISPEGQNTTEPDSARAESEPTERDGGTNVAAHSDFRSAYKSVSREDKRRAFIMLGAAAVTLAVIGLSRLLWLLEPVYDLVYYGVVSEAVYYVVLALLYAGYFIGLKKFIDRKCGIRLSRERRKPLVAWRAFACLGVAAFAVFVISAAFGFTLKLQREMGMGVTGAKMLINISVCFYYALHLWLGFTAASLVQYACSILLPTRYTVPWGSVFLVAVYGVLELIFETYTTNHMFPWVYFIFSFAYAAIFAVSGRRRRLSYWASVIILIL